MEQNMALLRQTWMQNEAPKFDSAFAATSHGRSDQRAVMRRKKPDYDLQNALKYYTTLEGHSSLAFDPANCSWADVFRLQSDAQVLYNSKAKGVSGSIRKAFRVVGDHPQYVEPLLDSIPDEMWGSALRISLGWMFSLIKDAAKTREKILSAFENVPGLILAAEARRKHFQGDAGFVELVDNLCDAVLTATTKFIAVLLPKHQVLKIFPMFSDVPSGSEIDRSIEKIEQAVSALDKKADILKDGILVDMHDRLRRGHQEIQSELHVTRQTALATNQQVAEVRSIAQQSSREIKETLASQEQNIVMTIQAAEQGLISAANGAREGMVHMINESIGRFVTAMQAREDLANKREKYILGRLEAVERELEFERARTPQPCVLASPGLSISELQRIICAPLQTTTRDFDYVLRQGLQFDHLQQSQIQWVLQQERFWQWFSMDSSDFLLAHGELMDFSDNQGRVSSLSVVCATIMASLSQTTSKAAGLYYFCGLHLSSYDDLRGPQGLLRCLISRLLVELDTSSGCTPNLGFVDALFLEQLQRRDVRYLYDLFSSIVMQFPPNTTIYCMIDGITWYERSDMREDLLRVTQTLYGLVDGQYSRCQLKVLITSPFRPRQLASGIPAHRQIVLQPTSLMLEASPGRMSALDLGLMQNRMYGEASSVNLNRVARPADEEWTADDFT